MRISLKSQQISTNHKVEWMGGDNFNKSDELNDFVGFAPVAKKQEQMNAEHASWLQESHLLNSNSQTFNSISKKIIEAASKDLSYVQIQATESCFVKISGTQVVNVLKKNGFNTNITGTSHYSRKGSNWNLIGEWVPDGGLQLVTFINISW